MPISLTFDHRAIGTGGEALLDDALLADRRSRINPAELVTRRKPGPGFLSRTSDLGSGFHRNDGMESHDPPQPWSPVASSTATPMTRMRPRISAGRWAAASLTATRATANRRTTRCWATRPALAHRGGEGRRIPRACTSASKPTTSGCRGRTAGDAWRHRKDRVVKRWWVMAIPPTGQRFLAPGLDAAPGTRALRRREWVESPFRSS